MLEPNNTADAELADEEIAKKVQAGDTDAFGILVIRYEPKLIRYAGRFLFNYQDSEDLIQNVFIKAFTNINSFDLEKKFSPWIYRIAHNEFISTIRKKKLEAVPFFDPDTLFPHPVANESTDNFVLQSEQRELVEQYLEKIEMKYREPLILYFFEDFDYKTIADILHIPVSTVGVRLSRGKNKLKKLLEQNNE